MRKALLGLALVVPRPRASPRPRPAARRRRPQIRAARRATSTSSRTGGSRSAPTTRRSRRGGAAAETQEAVEDLEPVQRARATSPRSPTRSPGSSASRRRQVEWTPCRSRSRTAPGKKPFDFVHGQVSVHARARARRSTSRTPYYFVNQALVGREGTPIAEAKSIAGSEARTSSARSSARRATSTSSSTSGRRRQPLAYDTNDLAVQALKNGQIDGIVVDLPTAFYVTAVQVDDGVIVGQFPTAAAGALRHGLREGQPARGAASTGRSTDCWANGTIKTLQKRWLAEVGGAPVLK